MSIAKAKALVGKYYLSVFAEQGNKELPKNKKIGIDLGLKDFLITSDDEKFKNNRYRKKYSRRLKEAQSRFVF